MINNELKTTVDIIVNSDNITFLFEDNDNITVTLYSSYMHQYLLNKLKGLDNGRINTNES